MNRKDFEEAVKRSDLNPYARFILRTYGERAGYKEEKPEVWPSKALVAQETGINKDIVAKYVTALIKDGWLVPAQMHGRAQGFYLEEGLLTIRTLMKAQRGSNLLMESDLSPDGVDTYLLMESGVSPDHQELTTKNNHIEQPIEQPVEDSQAHPPTESIQGGKEEVDRLEKLRVKADAFLFGLNEAGPGLSKKELDKVYNLNMSMSGPNLPLEKAVAKVYEDRTMRFDIW